jgi:hypothetical protein
MNRIRSIQTLACCLLLCASVALAAGPAEARGKTRDDAASACREAATLAERKYRIPAGLLNAISLVESGRQTGSRSARTAWPWTIHAEGTGRWLDSRDEAVAMVEGLKADGVRNIDVGCMQVNLMHHPDAFPDLATAFEPMANADYAARFLTELFRETRSWTRAVAFYHSRTPERASRYRKLVLAEWNGQAANARRALREDVKARTGRNTAASRHLRVNRSTVYIQSGRNSIRIRRY